MILDNENRLCNAQSFTSTDPTAAGSKSHVINLGSDRNIGIGEPMAVVLSLPVAAEGAGADNQTYSIAINTDTVEACDSPTLLGTITFAKLDAAGTKKVFVIPADTTMEQFLQLVVTVTGTIAGTGLTLDAELVPLSFVQNDGVYPDNITIS
jgi:hypothetical protein